MSMINEISNKRAMLHFLHLGGKYMRAFLVTTHFQQWRALLLALWQNGCTTPAHSIVRQKSAVHRHTEVMPASCHRLQQALVEKAAAHTAGVQS